MQRISSGGGEWGACKSAPLGYLRVVFWLWIGCGLQQIIHNFEGIASSKFKLLQAVERIRNQQVAGSNPIAGSRKIKGLQCFYCNPFFFGEAQGKRQGKIRILKCLLPNKIRKSNIQNEKNSTHRTWSRMKKQLKCAAGAVSGTAGWDRFSLATGRCVDGAGSAASCQG